MPGCQWIVKSAAKYEKINMPAASTLLYMGLSLHPRFRAQLGARDCGQAVKSRAYLNFEKCGYILAKYSIFRCCRIVGTEYQPVSSGCCVIK
jgi:hypothetical protein